MMHLRKKLPRLAKSEGPSIAIEISARQVSSVELSLRGGVPFIANHALALLPNGSLTPNTSSMNINRPDKVVEAIRTVLDSLPDRTNRVALILPDAAAQVLFLQFEKVPTRIPDLERLIEWEAQKLTRFRGKETHLVFSNCSKQAGGRHEFIVTLIRRDILEEYEAVCRDAGLHAGIVELNGFNVINAAIATLALEESDWLLVHLQHQTCTIAIVRGQDLVFFRNRPTESLGELESIVHQTVMFYEDRLNGSCLTRTVLAGNSELASTDLEIMLERTTGALVKRLGSARVASGFGVSIDCLNELAGSIGLLICERSAAA